MIDFPLCFLKPVRILNSKVESMRWDKLVSYSVIIKAKEIDSINFLDSDILEDAAEELNLNNLESLTEKRINAYYELENILNRNIESYGKQPYSRIGRELVFSLRDKKFDENMFRVLCAISSVIGKQAKFKRITYNTLRFRMWGFKNEKEFKQDNLSKKIKLLTDRQLARIVKKLHSLKFFSKFTYQQRQIFYSTKLNDEELFNAVSKSKIYWETHKEEIKKDYDKSNQLKEQIDLIRKYNSRSKLKLIKCG